MTSQFVPGQKLILRTLASDLNISPTPVREALFKLVSENLLVINARGTVCIPEMTSSKYLELRGLRVLLEGEAAARTAELAKKEDIGNLKTIQTELESALAESRYAEALELNKSFHFALCRYSGSGVLAKMVENLWAQCGPILARLYEDGHDRSIQHPHREVLSALERGDSEQARKSIGLDIVVGGRPMLEILKRQELR